MVKVSKAIAMVALSAGIASNASAFTVATRYGLMSVSPPKGQVVAAPEIDPAGALSGLTLLVGGLAVVRAGRAKK